MARLGSLSHVVLLAVTAAVTSCTLPSRQGLPGPPGQTRYLPPGRGSPPVNERASGATAPGEQRVSEGLGPGEEWWTLWRSPELDRLVRRALARNQSLASAEAHLQAARQRIAAAAGALYPQVDGAVSVQRTRLGATVLGVDAKPFPVFSAYAAGVQVTYDVDLFGGIRERVRNAAAEAQYAATLRDAAALSVAGNVVLQAVQIASVRAQLRVIEAIVADDEQVLRLVHALHDEGVAARTDVLIEQSQADHDRTLLPPLRQQLAAARDALAILAGAAPADGVPPDLDLDALTLPQQLPVAVPSELVRRRPDILAAEAQLRVAETAVGIATADRYPHLVLSSALAPEGLVGGPSEVAWNLLGGLMGPIFDGGTRQARQQAAEDDYRSVLAAYQQTVLEAFAQVADSLQALANDADELNAQRRALESADASLELTRAAYREGTSALLEVLEAQRLREQALLGEVQARAQRQVDSVKLLLAAGGRVAPQRLPGG